MMPKSVKTHRRKLKPLQIVLITVAGLIILCMMASIGSFLVGYTPERPPTPARKSPAVAKGSAELGKGASPSPAPKPIHLKGKGNSVVRLNRAISGSFRVDYSFGSFCGVVQFRTIGNEDGAGFMEDINDCSRDLETDLEGSTIVRLTNVALFRVDNTSGPWTLTLTPLE